jgi:hypothetical protein
MKDHERRLRQLEDALDPVAALLKKEGLSAVLQAGALLAKQDAWDDPEDGQPTTGMGVLLAEAKAWLKAEKDQAC